MLNVAKIVNDSTIYGPETRTVIWFQGCSIKCKGCINPELIPFINKNQYNSNDLIDKIINKGVTLLGGEPLDQDDIYIFLHELKEKNHDIVLFTGYDWKDLSNEQQDIISSTCQFAVIGPFDIAKANKNLYLKGSGNQEIKVFDPLVHIDEKLETYEIVISDVTEVRGRVTKDIFELLENN